MRYRVLGPLAVENAGAVVTPSSRARRVTLAALLLHAGRPVSVSRLAGFLWDDDTSPADPRSAVQLHVLRLRRALPDGGPIETVPDGYRIAAGPADLDLLRFQELTVAARAHVAAGDLAEADDALTEAQELWRGQPLTDVDSDALRRAHLPALAEQHLTVAEAFYEVRIARGRVGPVLADLRQAAEEHPLREKLHALLVTALCATDRRAEALEAFHRCRTVLRDELGCEPGTRLLAAYRKALGPPAAARPPVPRQLPGPPRLFVGRTAETRAVTEALAGGSGLVVVSGAGGTGKTALVRRWADDNADAYPEGQFYVRLGAHADTGAHDVDIVLGRLLVAVGVPPQRIPPGAEERSALWRSTVAGRRMLLVLDDAASASTVRPLLTGSGPAILVTSRDAMDDLVHAEGAYRVVLGRLPVDEAGRLFAAGVGARRAEAAPEAARRLIDLCAGLPLALRLLSERLAGFPEVPLADLAADLEAEQDRLAAVGSSDGGGAADLRAVFASSYRALGEGIASMFRHLSRWPGPDFTVAAAAVWTGVPDAAARTGIDHLCAHSLVEELSPGRYSLHDLLRGYIAGIADTEDGPLCRDVIRRVVDWYVHSGRPMVEALPSARTITGLPEGPSTVPAAECGDPVAAERWLAAETANVLDLVRSLEPVTDAVEICRLGRTYLPFLHRRRHIDDWSELAERTLDAATVAGFDDILATAVSHLGLVSAQRGDIAAAVERAERAVALRASRDPLWYAVELRNLGIAYRRAGRYEDARACHERAGRISLESGDEGLYAVDVNNLGHVDLHQGCWDAAVDRLTEAARLARRTGRRTTEANALDGLGHALLGRGERDEAVACLRAAQAIYVEQRSTYQAAVNEAALAEALKLAGRCQEAATHRRAADGVPGGP